MIRKLARSCPGLWLGMVAAALLALVLGLALVLHPLVLTSSSELGAEHGSEAAGKTTQTGNSAVEPMQSGPPDSPKSDSPEPAAPSSPQGGLALVMDDMGESTQALRSLLELGLPMNFALWPHARFAEESARLASAAGHTLLIHQPMQPRSATAQTGPNSLREGMSREEMEALLRQAMLKLPQAEGINNHMGSRFTANRPAVRELCAILAPSGLFVLDSVTHASSVLYEEALKAGIPAARRDIFIDAEPGKEAALRQLQKAEQLALQGKQLVAIGHPLPSTLAALREWNASRDAALRFLPLRVCLTRP